ncbi:MAG: radical SAM protein [Candidatus Thermoplasmatota archaeon]|nr:radical SAM protein [Candidatus Thermoplasmatota archaeon]
MKKFYHPGEKFPSISVTGDTCALSCPHCEGKFLKGMKHISEPEELYRFALKFEDSGGNGFLLSGGCNERGEVPIADFCPVLSEIKETTSLEINVHTGLPSEETAEKLAGTDIDTVSYDMIGSKETIDRIYGIDATPTDYKKAYEMLRRKGIKVVPHITVGLNGGELQGECRGIELLDGPSKLILNSFIPKNFGKTVGQDDFFSVMAHVPQRTDIILGCMRERGRHGMEKKALKRGAKGIVNPSKETVSWAEKNYEIKRIEKCCAL